ncbi:MAG: hypothetical protein ACYT04_44210 [Nostoc sp.]
MSRRKTEQQLKLQLQYAEARKAYTPPKREEGATGKQRKSQKARYNVMSRSTAEPLFYTINAASNSVKFFADGALAELGLALAAADGSPPRGFKPVKIHATQSTDEGTVKHAKDSGRPYMSYSRSGGQASYSAPICSTEGVIGVVTKVKAITEAKKGSIGPYGRIWFTPEYFVILD